MVSNVAGKYGEGCQKPTSTSSIEAADMPSSSLKGYLHAVLHVIGPPRKSIWEKRRKGSIFSIFFSFLFINSLVYSF
jgi:hypothetical protein